MLKLLRISFRLIESWEFPSQTLSGAISNSLTVGNPNQITEKLADLKVGISVLIKVRETRFILDYSIFSYNVSSGHTRRYLYIFRAYLDSNDNLPFVSAQGCLDGQPNMDDNDSLPLPFEDFYLTMGESSLRESFRLLACFKKDMHKVETYLRVANCRRSLDSNCTL